MNQQKLKFSSLLVVMIILFLSFSQGAPEGRTGAPDENSCADAPCHGNSAEFDGQIEFIGFPAALVAGQTFELGLSVVATTGSPTRGGLSATILGDFEGQLVDIGEFSNEGPDLAIDFIQGRNRTYLSHSPAKSFGSSDRVTYTVNWTTPNSFDVDTVIVYAAAVLANGNGGRTGDQVILNQLIIPVTNTIDADNDGFNSDVDCNDNDPAINPDATEIVNNDVDENCDGEIVIIDLDDDGFNSDDDCNDMEASISPGEIEIPNNDVDENCDGEIVIIDEDNDGFNSDDDCNDNDASINPDATEIPNNNVDENCDGIILTIDEDDDGFNSEDDCNDMDATINPDATEIPNNNIDENCDGIDGIEEMALSGVVVDFNNEPVINALLIDASSQVELGSTDNQGRFEITVQGNTRLINFEKEASYVSGLSSIDLILTRNHILGNAPFQSELQRFSADVNGDNSVSATDLVVMRRIILQLTFDVPNPAWNFVPAQIDVTEMNIPDTIQAYKLGDVNSSASN